MGLVGRSMAVLLGGAAMTVLLGAQVSRAQEVDAAGQEIAAAQDQAGQPMEQPPVEASSVTVLDKITIVSRTGESAISFWAASPAPAPS